MAAVDPVEFIQGLQLAPQLASLRSSSSSIKSLPPDNKQQGYVDAGAVHAFPDTLTGQNKADILNSTLLAQLAADKQYDRQNEPTEWYTLYSSVLSTVGWIDTTVETFDKYTPTGGTFTMDAAVRAVMGQCGVNTDQLSKVLGGLKATGDSDVAVTTFNQHSYDATKGGNFQVNVAAKDGDSVVLAKGAFYFAYTKPVARFLFHEWNAKDVILYWKVEKAQLNEEQYSRARQQIVDKLGDRISQLEVQLIL